MTETRKINWYGTFEVKTEGDVEGRYSVNLGTYTGYVDEIAGYLADKTYYKLEFKQIDPVKTFGPPKRKRVSIAFDINSDLYQASPQQITEKILRQGRENFCKVERSNYYNSNELVFLTETEDDKRAKALAKLTPAEQKLLGLVPEKVND